MSALLTRDDGHGAVVALVGPNASQGQIVDLADVRSSEGPPLIASAGDRLLVVVPGQNDNRRKLRVASVQGATAQAEVRWGVELAQSKGDSQRFGVAAGKSRGVVAWDEADAKGGRGSIRVVDFSLADISQASPPRTVSPEASDVEGVQIVRRPGGYWVAWISHSSYGQSDPASDAGASADTLAAAASADGPAPVVDLGSRWLELMRLGEDGAPAGAPVVVTGKESHVLVFDLAPGPDGSAWLAWRDDRTSPGAEQRSVHLARVRPDGGRDTHVVRDEQLGAGAPSLIVSELGAGEGPAGWLALDSLDDEMRVAALDVGGKLLDLLAPDPVIGEDEPLALRAGKLLLARPLPTAIQLSLATCRAGAPGSQLLPDSGLPRVEVPPEEPPLPTPSSSR